MGIGMREQIEIFDGVSRAPVGMVVGTREWLCPPRWLRLTRVRASLSRFVSHLLWAHFVGYTTVGFHAETYRCHRRP
jgi:hypothetical protein